VHGGATSSAYFDCPGHPRLSLLRLAATHGFTAIALDRPGYGAGECCRRRQKNHENECETDRDIGAKRA